MAHWMLRNLHVAIREKVWMTWHKICCWIILPQFILSTHTLSGFILLLLRTKTAGDVAIFASSDHLLLYCEIQALAAASMVLVMWHYLDGMICGLHVIISLYLNRWCSASYHIRSACYMSSHLKQMRKHFSPTSTVSVDFSQIYLIMPLDKWK